MHEFFYIVNISNNFLMLKTKEIHKLIKFLKYHALRKLFTLSKMFTCFKKFTISTMATENCSLACVQKKQMF
jgi:hypothetical protein